MSDLNDTDLIYSLSENWLLFDGVEILSLVEQSMILLYKGPTECWNNC